MARHRRLTARNLTGLSRLTAGLLYSLPADAQTVPFSDTEDASIGSVSVGDGRLHPIARLNLRNGDYARGNYDDDALSLDRLPVHVELGLVYDLRRGDSGDADAWIELHSSNGLHAPSSAERADPRAWYESNNLVGLVVAPTKGLRTGLSYTFKASPNGVASTTHEASVAISYQADRGFGWLRPSAVATIRPKGDHGLYTQAGMEPEIKLGSGDDAPSIGVPLLIGIGWDGFYQAGSGTTGYGTAGLAYTRPFSIGTTKWSLRAEMAALVRADALARLDGDDANRATIVPIGQMSLTLAY